MRFILLFCLVFGLAAALTDQEMYTQLLNFITVHSNIPSDHALVQQILSSDRWIQLNAEFGGVKKK